MITIILTYIERLYLAGHTDFVCWGPEEHGAAARALPVTGVRWLRWSCARCGYVAFGRRRASAALLLGNEHILVPRADEF